MNSLQRISGLCASLALAGLTNLAPAHAQYYTFFPSDKTVNYGVYSPTNIVGYASGIDGNFVGSSSPTVNFVPGCYIGGSLSTYNHSTVNISSDVESIIDVQDNSTVNVTHGSIYALGGMGNSVINFSGGSTSDLEAGDNSRVTFSGGHTDFLGTLASGILNIKGGDFDDLAIDESGSANFFGTSLITSLLDPDHFGSSLYAISGTLSDGTLLNGKNFTLRNGTGATFNLIDTAVPEPGSLALLLGVGVSGIGLLMRRRRK